MDLVILTPIEIEYRSIRLLLNDLEKKYKEGLLYEIGQFQGKNHKYTIALRLTGSKNAKVALAAEKAVQHWRPEMVWLLGVAGGVKDVHIGDVVVGTKAYGYESGKETPEGFVARPEVYFYNGGLVEQARAIERAGAWQKRFPEAENVSKVIFGPIASGDKVIASIKSPIYHRLKKHYNDTIALEMESTGFASAMAAYSDIPAINIRGVSDLLENKTQSDSGGGQALAMKNLAAFVAEFLFQFDFTQLKKHYSMNVNKLAQQIVSLLFPLLKLDSVKQIGREFREATDGSISEIWKKVKPIFIEEIEDVEAEELEDEKEQIKLQGAIESSLKKQLKRDNEFKTALIQLLQEAEEKTPGAGSVTISNSKNVISGSSIKVGRDFRLGDEKTSIG